MIWSWRPCKCDKFIMYCHHKYIRKMGGGGFKFAISIWNMQLFNEIADFNGNVLMKCWWCPLLLQSKLKHGLYSHQTCSSFENGAFISIQIVLQFDFLKWSFPAFLSFCLLLPFPPLEACQSMVGLFSYYLKLL